MQNKINEHLKHRMPVQVISMIDFDGHIRPYRLRNEAGEILRIDAIRDYTHCAALRAGGAGWRYTVIIAGRELYLFHDDEGPFFLEI